MFIKITDDRSITHMIAVDKITHVKEEFIRAGIGGMISNITIKFIGGTTVCYEVSERMLEYFYKELTAPQEKMNARPAKRSMGA